uniref:Ankyrin repeat, SAM and basic leucine zipper domain-containing protein 1 n=1 Tax=Mola mola TaxID=94237 RepID=A0A3Q3W3M9_MOLML
MRGSVEYAIPAGDESDTSNDEWDIGFLENKTSSINDQDAVAPHGQDDVLLLKRAISNGDTETVERLLDNGMDVETRLGLGWTPLMCAVSVANYDLAKLLLDRGANASFNKDGWTVLMVSTTAAVSEDKIARCAELLLSRNADPNMVDRSQMTCLMLAARDGYTKVIILLVSHRAEINVQNSTGYTALSLAVQYGRQEAVLKLLQLGADQTIRTKSGKSPADLAVIFKHSQISKILASSCTISTVQIFSSLETTHSMFLKTSTEASSSEGCVNKLDELQLFLHGLDLGYIADIMTENDVTWSYLLTMEKEDLEKIGVIDLVDQQKVLKALQQMHLDKVDLDTISRLNIGDADSGSEELHNFILSVKQQCCYLTETIHNVIGRFPCQASQLVFSLDPKKESRAVCNELVLQTKDLHKEVTCLRNLLCQDGDCCQPPQPGSYGNWWMRSLTRVALGATFLLLLYKAATGKINLHVCKSVY